MSLGLYKKRILQVHIPRIIIIIIKGHVYHVYTVYDDDRPKPDIPYIPWYIPLFPYIVYPLYIPCIPAYPYAKRICLSFIIHVLLILNTLNRCVYRTSELQLRINNVYCAPSLARTLHKEFQENDLSLGLPFIWPNPDASQRIPTHREFVTHPDAFRRIVTHSDALSRIGLRVSVAS